MDVFIDGIQYVPAGESCCNVAHLRPIGVGDYVVVDNIAHEEYDVDASILGEAGKVVDWPTGAAYARGQLAVELPGYSFMGYHILGFWPDSLSRFEEDE